MIITTKLKPGTPHDGNAKRKTMNFQCKDQTDYLELTVSGTADTRDWDPMLQSIVHHPDWRRGLSLLADFCRMDCTEVTPGDVLKATYLTIKMTRQLGQGRVAILVNDDLNFGLARMFLGHAEDKLTGTYGLFRERNLALAWLATGDALEGAAPA